MKIYYTNDELIRAEDYRKRPRADMSMSFLNPEPLKKHIPSNIKLSNYVRCPAFTDTLKNTKNYFRK